MSKELFKSLIVGNTIINIKSGVEYKLRTIVSENPLVWEMSNQKYLGMIDYVNENTCDEYVSII